VYAYKEGKRKGEKVKAVAEATGWKPGVLLPAGAGNFSLRSFVQIGTRAHPTSSLTGTGGSFPGDKAPGA